MTSGPGEKTMEKTMEEVNEELGREDYNYEVISSLFDSVSLMRGLGYSGREVHIVEKECEMCHYDRMVQTIRVSPESPDTFEYQCQNPNCPDFHDGRLGIRTMR